MLSIRQILLMLLCLNVSAGFAQSATVAKTSGQVSIQNAWVRATNPGQEVAAAYMTLTSAVDTTLFKVDSDLTNSVEIHSMSMQNSVMKMRKVDKLTLSAGKTYQLAPGGYHLMLFDLKKQLTAGEQVEFTLHFKDKKDVTFKQKVTVPVQSSAEETGKDNAHEHHH